MHADANPQGQNRWFRSLQRRLGNVIRDPDKHVLAFGEGEDTNFNPFNNRITFLERTFTESYIAAGSWCKYGQRNQPYSAAAAVAHELLGHAEAPGLRQVYQPRAIEVENEYHRAVGEAARCRWE